jgi:hypothetical protein
MCHSYQNKTQLRETFYEKQNDPFHHMCLITHSLWASWNAKAADCWADLATADSDCCGTGDIDRHDP